MLPFKEENIMKTLKTRKEINGYTYSNGSAGKRWKRGRTMFSEGRKWLDNNEYVPIIAKTNLDTHEITEASVNEYKRFLTEDGYKEFLEARFVAMASK